MPMVHIEMSQLLASGLLSVLAVLTVVTVRAWRASLVAVRPRMPLRTCRRLSANVQRISARFQEFTLHSEMGDDRNQAQAS